MEKTTPEEGQVREGDDLFKSLGKYKSNGTSACGGDWTHLNKIKIFQFEEFAMLPGRIFRWARPMYFPSPKEEG